MSHVSRLYDRKLITPPRWLPSNVAYETIMGSHAYGTTIDSSDIDVYGFCFPPKETVFPHTSGVIVGFGTQPQEFLQFQQHHINDAESRVEYDITIYSIVRYFQLAMDNNPNIIDSLFTPSTCVLHATPVANLVRENRTLFLHKGCWPKFKGYAYSQLKKMKGEAVGKRKELVEKYTFDVKFAAHTVRLLLEVEQIMAEGDIDLQRDREQLKSIRRGEWTIEEIEQWASDKERHLETLYSTSKLRQKPDEPAIKQLLLNCLESHYGDLSSVIVREDAAITALRNIQSELDRMAAILR